MISTFYVMYSRFALLDLGGIYNYINSYLSARKAAERTIRRIKDLVESLSFMPERFALAESLSFRGWR